MFLMQRLQAPPQCGPSDGVLPHHVFGGAMLGLGKEGWKVLDQLCTLDYMGAAEYEFGRLPQFLTFWAQRAGEGKILPFAFVMKVGEYEGSWERSPYRREKKPLPRMQDRVVYGLYGNWYSTPERLEADFRKVANKKLYVKEGAYTEKALDPVSDREKRSRPLGWIVLDDDAMLFVDETLWRAFAALFVVDLEGFEPPTVSASPDYALMNKPAMVAAAVACGVVSNKTQARKMKKPELLAALLAGE